MKVFLRFLFLGLSGVLWAGLGFSGPPTIPKGKILVGEFCRVSRISGLNKPFESSGTFMVWPHHGIIWQCLVPFQATYVVTAEGIYEENSHGSLEAMEGPSFSETKGMSGCFEALLTGDVERVSPLWKVSEETPLEPSGWRMRLEAKDQVLSKILPTVVISGGKQVTSIELYTKGSDDQRTKALPATEIQFTHTHLENADASSETYRRYFKESAL